MAEIIGPVVLTRDNAESWAEMEEPAARIALTGSTPLEVVAGARFELATGYEDTPDQRARAQILSLPEWSGVHQTAQIVAARCIFCLEGLTRRQSSSRILHRPVTPLEQSAVPDPLDRM